MNAFLSRVIPIVEVLMVVGQLGNSSSNLIVVPFLLIYLNVKTYYNHIISPFSHTSGAIKYHLRLFSPLGKVRQSQFRISCHNSPCIGSSRSIAISNIEIPKEKISPAGVTTPCSISLAMYLASPSHEGTELFYKKMNTNNLEFNYL